MRNTTSFPAGCTLYHSRNAQLDGLASALAREGVAIQPIDRPADVSNHDHPAVVVADRTLTQFETELAALPDEVTVLPSDELSVPLLRAAFDLSAARLHNAHSQSELDHIHDEVTALNRTGMALMAERDLATLLRQILDAAMRITTSDAGGIFLIEKREDGAQLLRYKVAHAESVPKLPPLEEFVLPVDANSLPGYVAVTRQPMVIDDVEDFPADGSFRQNNLVEKLAGYTVRSLLSIPMVDHKDRVVGVLQLANRKKDPAALLKDRQDVELHVVSYSWRDTHIAFSLAGQAAVAIENASLHEQIEHLFESFTKAAVTAIDQRDPSTAGHSLRVAALVVDLAYALERDGTGPYRNLQFTPAQIRELRYAALLHDFGKVGVREEVLVKAKKLPPTLWERVHARFDLIRLSLDLEYERQRLRLARTGAGATELATLAGELARARYDVDRFYTAVRAANDPSLPFLQSPSELLEMTEHVFQHPDGELEPYLSEQELHFLQIPHGTLDDEERREIQTHAQQTYHFLSQMPWTEDLLHVPDFAAAHHEKLDGTGYPRHLRGDDIPVQTRIMTVADIFDALTAHDRPYKHVVRPDAALEIIRSEAQAGALDPDVVRVLIESRVYLRPPP